VNYAVIAIKLLTANYSRIMIYAKKH